MDPTVTPTLTPDPNPIIIPVPLDLHTLLLVCYVAGGFVFSAIVSWLVDRIFQLWVWLMGKPHFAWLPPLTDTKKRFISIWTPAVVVMLGYFGLCLDGTFIFNEDTLSQALSAALSTIAGTHIVFATFASVKYGTTLATRALQMGVRELKRPRG